MAFAAVVDNPVVKLITGQDTPPLGSIVLIGSSPIPRYGKQTACKDQTAPIYQLAGHNFLTRNHSSLCHSSLKEASLKQKKIPLEPNTAGVSNSRSLNFKFSVFPISLLLFLEFFQISISVFYLDLRNLHIAISYKPDKLKAFRLKKIFFSGYQ